jgi:methylation protein EvaC
LNDNGILIIQDPSLLELIKSNAYDQFYNEHIYVFSYLSLSNIVRKHNLEIFHLENVKDHGGSIRYYIKKKEGNHKIENSIKTQKKKEIKYGLNKFNTYVLFRKRVELSKKKLIEIFKKILKKNKKIIGYGATAKAVTVLNYCNVNNNLIKFFVDTTPEKQGKYMPGVQIPVKKYSKLSKKNVDYVFLGAWNFRNEIFKKEKKFLSENGKFITHLPFPRIIS